MKSRAYILVLMCVGCLVSGLRCDWLFALHATSAQTQTITSAEGEAIYKQRCAACHDNATDRVPPLFLIRRRSAEDVMQTLTEGSMRQQARGLSQQQIRELAIFLTGKQPGAPLQNLDANRCKNPASPLNLKAAHWNGWGRDFENTRYQPNPGLAATDVPKLKVKWAFGHPGAMATGQPTVIGDRLFLTIEAGLIYSLDAQTGCTRWVANTGAAVRAALSIGAIPKGKIAGSEARFALYLGDEKSRVQALDADTGKLLWKTKVEDHFLSRVTGAPVLYRDVLYVPLSSFEETAGRDVKYECCTFRGSIVALDAYSGKILWKSFTVQDAPQPHKKNSAGTQMHGPAGGAIWSAPTLDLKRGLLYAATGNSYTDLVSLHTDAIVAYQLNGGKLQWANQVTPKDNFLVGCRQPGVGNCPDSPGPDYDFGSSVILRKLPNGKSVILAGQKSGVLYALDPDQQGKKLWEIKLGNGGALGGIEWGFTADEQNVYVPMADVGGAKRQPGITAVKIATGEKLWFKAAPEAKCAWGTARCSNSQSAAASAMPGIVFSGSADGHLRAYRSNDGEIVWDFDTAAETYATVNGMSVKGGTLDGGGPVIAKGIVYTNSGYGRLIGQPGNLLLAFSVDGK